MEVAWTVSGVALGGARNFGSAVLHVEAEWDLAEARRPIAVRCVLVRAAVRTPVLVGSPLHVAALQHGAWFHLRVSDGREELLRASFESGRLIYATGTLPSRAGLLGGTYEAPSGTLDLED